MRRSYLLPALYLLLLAALPFGHARADDSPDRPFPADRPGKASGPFTVDAGHFDIESDFVNLTADSNAAAITRGVVFADPLLKAGLTRDIDIELQLGGLQRYDVKDRSGGTKTHTIGYGDETIRLKVNLAGNDGSDFAIALLPSIKIPSATDSLRKAGLANNRIEGGLLVPMNYNLPHDFALGYQAEWDAAKNAGDGDFHANIVNIALLSHPVPRVDNMTATLEFYSNISTSKAVSDLNILTLDPSITYQVSPQLVFDVETDIGLNRGATDLQMIFGITRVF